MEGRGESMILMNSVEIRSIETTGGRSRLALHLMERERPVAHPKAELTGKANGSHHYAERVISKSLIGV